MMQIHFSDRANLRKRMSNILTVRILDEQIEKDKDNRNLHTAETSQYSTNSNDLPHSMEWNY